tara:strand:- start:8250 stop:9272 length:1023 start_codon:yes stop_codon:yes gene_type:complete
MICRNFGDLAPCLYTFKMSESEQSYSLVILSKVDPERELPADIFLKIDQKYIRFRGCGDIIGAEKFDDFMHHGLEGIFVKDDDIMTFLDWVTFVQNEEVEALVAEVGEETKEIAIGVAKVKQKVYESFFEQELSDEVVEQLQDQVADFVSTIKKQPFSQQTIAALTKKNATIADHSVNVANISVYLAMVMGQSHQYVLENVYLGAILHDLGKAKSGLTESGVGDMRFSSQAMQNHPELSVQVMRKSKGVPDPVYKIILQHHEQWNGYGYPAGLEGEAIYEMAQIVSIANFFDNILFENRDKPRDEAWDIALKRVDHDKERFWAPKFFPRVLQALTKAKPT